MPKASDPFHTTTDGSEPRRWVDVQVFQCSLASCSARLITRLRPPKLKSEWVNLLVDPALINARARKVMENEPARYEGHALPSSITVLTNLRAYISNALSNPEPRRIVGNNKKWLLSLGDPCAELLEYLGFQRDVSSRSDQFFFRVLIFLWQGDDWMPPRPDVTAATPYINPLNILLDDIDKELLILLESRYEEEKHMVKVHTSSVSVVPELQRLLGCQGCNCNDLISNNVVANDF